MSTFKCTTSWSLVSHSFRLDLFNELGLSDRLWLIMLILLRSRRVAVEHTEICLISRVKSWKFFILLNVLCLPIFERSLRVGIFMKFCLIIRSDICHSLSENCVLTISCIIIWVFLLTLSHFQSFSERNLIFVVHQGLLYSFFLNFGRASKSIFLNP